MIKEITLVRHGICTGNVADRSSYRGDHSYFTEDIRIVHSDMWPLTPEGIEQSRNTGSKIRDLIANSFDCYVHSGVLRVRDTATHLGFDSANWITDRLLRERNWGGVENLPYNERNKIFDEFSIPHSEDSIHWNPPRGESMSSVINNVSFFLHRLNLMYSGKRILAVTHGGPLQAMRVIQNRISEAEYVEFVSGNNYIRNCQIIHYSQVAGERFTLERMLYMTQSGDWQETVKEI
jgi:broad specificity phosphatase PhoE